VTILTDWGRKKKKRKINGVESSGEDNQALKNPPWRQRTFF
jgi:hypothetical protein